MTALASYLHFAASRRSWRRTTDVSSGVAVTSAAWLESELLPWKWMTMPQLADLQRSTPSPATKPGAVFDYGSGEEILVPDMRSRRSYASLVEEKLGRLIEQMSPGRLGHTGRAC